jgi:phosphatidylserine decarboxylase
MATVWHGMVNPPRRRQVETWEYTTEHPVALRQGEEMGRFLLGSTVVLLWPDQALRFNPEWGAGKPVRLGEVMASIRP